MIGLDTNVLRYLAQDDAIIRRRRRKLSSVS